MPAEECLEIMNHRKLHLRSLQWINGSPETNPITCNYCIGRLVKRWCTDPQCLEVFPPHIKWTKLIHISGLIILQIDTEITSAMALWIPGLCMIHSDQKSLHVKRYYKLSNFAFFLKVASCNISSLISYLLYVAPIEWNFFLHTSNLA